MACRHDHSRGKLVTPTGESDPRLAGHPRAERRSCAQRVLRMVRMMALPNRDPDWSPTPLPAVRTASNGGLITRHFSLPVDGPTLAGKRLLLFSDLHWSRRDTQGAEKLVDAVNQVEADWIAFVGDLTRYLEHSEPALRVLGRLSAQRHRLATLGNWERNHHWMSDSRWRRLFEQAGFQLLVNETWEDPGPDGPVFVGMDDFRLGDGHIVSGPPLPPDTRLVVRLAHCPDAVGQTTGLDLGQLVLCGHTHGGQIRAPRLGAFYTSSYYGKAFEYGWYRRASDGTRMYVSSGIGCTGSILFRRRLHCPPEVVVIEFVSPTDNRAAREEGPAPCP